jgi:hypothetical protein
MGVPALSVTRYSANLGGPSCTAERNSDWLEEAADANCTGFKRRSGWITIGAPDAPDIEIVALPSRSVRRQAGRDGRGSYSKRKANWPGKKNLNPGCMAYFSGMTCRASERFRCASGSGLRGWAVQLQRARARHPGARRPPLGLDFRDYFRDAENPDVSGTRRLCVETTPCGMRRAFQGRIKC